MPKVTSCMDSYASLLPYQHITVCRSILMLWQQWQLAQTELWPQMRRNFSI